MALKIHRDYVYSINSYKAYTSPIMTLKPINFKLI